MSANDMRVLWLRDAKEDLTGDYKEQHTQSYLSLMLDDRWISTTGLSVANEVFLILEEVLDD